MTPTQARPNDDADYLYRFQTRASLRHMREHVGDYLCPSRWTPGESCPHQGYIDLKANLPKDQAIYTLSVWRNEALARRELRQRSCGTDDYVLLRIPRKAIADAGLICIEDDFLPDEALLCYEIAPFDIGSIYGTAKVPWGAIDQNDPAWGDVTLETEHLYAVAHPYAKDYLVWDIGNDAGLPSDEKVLRLYLRHLTQADATFRQTVWWKRIGSEERQRAWLDAWNLWLRLDRANPRTRAAADRLLVALPNPHPWRKYLLKIVKKR